MKAAREALAELPGPCKSIADFSVKQICRTSGSGRASWTGQT